MSGTAVASYGSWRSPISSDLLVCEAVRLNQTRLDGQTLYWLETRPGEGGRNVIVRRNPDGRAEDVTPQPFNARTRVHEYGGGDFAVEDGVVYFTNFEDQRLYRLAPPDEPRPLTAGTNQRYADMTVDARRARIIAVRESHPAGHEPVNELVAVDLEGSEETVLASGADFYSSPRLSPDGNRLAWLSWEHPNMPWDHTELWVGEVAENGSLEKIEKIAGDNGESVFQPEFSPDGTLYFVSDRTGWWNLYRLRGGHVKPLCEMEAEFGLPQWVFGMSTYAFLEPARIACAYIESGSFRLATLNTEAVELTPIETPYTTISGLRTSEASGGAVFFIGSSPTEPASLVRVNPETGEREVLRRSREAEVDNAYLSVPEPVEFPTANGRTAHAFFYPPKNRDYAGPEGEKPPLLVMSHGGPTSMTTAALDLEIQFWSSRGIGVLDVNYGGSTGYGREYRERLYGEWGVVDVEDCENGARFLAERGLVDGDRLIIRGGSAGGYTTLCALTFGDAFAAGASYYGVSDAEALAKETHKFESRYLDQLIGPYPERADLYRERSPIHASEKLSCPVIFFQGLEDGVVPPNQAETMVEALREKGVPVAYVPFEGEQHGFRRSENIKRALDAELYFYSRVFGFRLAEPVEPVQIENL